MFIFHHEHHTTYPRPIKALSRKNLRDLDHITDQHPTSPPHHLPERQPDERGHDLNKSDQHDPRDCGQNQNVHKRRDKREAVEVEKNNRQGKNNRDR